MATKNSRSQLMVSEMMCLSSSYIDNNRERNSGSLLSELNVPCSSLSLWNLEKQKISLS